jgi:hypothetical protein
VRRSNIGAGESRNFVADDDDDDGDDGPQIE